MKAGDIQLLPLYSFDTSAIINGRRDLFLPNTFEALWRKIEEQIVIGCVRAVDEVKREIEKKDDEVHAWVVRQRGLFVPLEQDIQIATKEILSKHPRLLGIGGSGERNGADPFVIALAMARGGTVVTEERERNIDKPRIPDVCKAMGVPWQTLPQYVNSQGWTARME